MNERTNPIPLKSVIPELQGFQEACKLLKRISEFSRNLWIKEEIKNFLEKYKDEIIDNTQICDKT